MKLGKNATKPFKITSTNSKMSTSSRENTIGYSKNEKPTLFNEALHRQPVGMVLRTLRGINSR